MGREARFSELGRRTLGDSGGAVIAVAQAEENSDPSRWNIVVEIVQLVFYTGDLAMDFMWYTTVLLPGNGG